MTLTRARIRSARIRSGRVRTARLTAGAAALAATATLAGPAPAGAAGRTWVDGAWVQETIISCITGQPAPGYTARVSFAGKKGRLPKVGETFYFKVEVGLPGLPCAKTPTVLPELVLPAGLRYADNAKNPVRWRKLTLDGGGSSYSTENLVFDRGRYGVLVGLKSAAYPQGGPIEVRQGESLEVQVPVRATKVMKGMATREPQCQDRINGDAPCPVKESGDHIQVAVSKSDTGPRDSVIPFVGVHVQKRVVTKLTAAVKAFRNKAGTARITVGGVAKPTGKVVIRKGKKRLAVGKLKARNKGVISLRLPKLAKGRHKLVVKYTGSQAVAPKKRTITVNSR
jgi:hypothetical protein